jgi:pimeloyl-ACP methyl ester carboxylesterase
MGIIPLGTSMDNENERTVQLGCWDGPKQVSLILDEATTKTAKPDFEPSDNYCNFLIDIGFGKDIDNDTRKQWTETIKKNYKGEDGRKRIREASVNLSERDSLHGRLPNILCPVLWLHGDKDVVYSVKNAEEEIKLFTNSEDAKLVVVSGGHHFLSWTNSEAVNKALLEWIPANAKGFKPSGRALREAVGMVEM